MFRGSGGEPGSTIRTAPDLNGRGRYGTIANLPMATASAGNPENRVQHNVSALARRMWKTTAETIRSMRAAAAVGTNRGRMPVNAGSTRQMAPSTSSTPMSARRVTSTSGSARRAGAAAHRASCR
jgi:hypothetical protein